MGWEKQMKDGIWLRQILGSIGAASGLALWGLWKVIDAGVFSDRLALAVVVFVATGLGAHMALSGPLSQRQAGLRTLLLGAV
jgi:hypothetical protein